jgi:hypothetical protein
VPVLRDVLAWIEAESGRHKKQSEDPGRKRDLQIRTQTGKPAA